jgi:hypothetical protein
VHAGRPPGGTSAPTVVFTNNVTAGNCIAFYILIDNNSTTVALPGCEVRIQLNEVSLRCALLLSRQLSAFNIGSS